MPEISEVAINADKLQHMVGKIAYDLWYNDEPEIVHNMKKLKLPAKIEDITTYGKKLFLHLQPLEREGERKDEKDGKEDEEPQIIMFGLGMQGKFRSKKEKHAVFGLNLCETYQGREMNQAETKKQDDWLLEQKERGRLIKVYKQAYKAWKQEVEEKKRKKDEDEDDGNESEDEPDEPEWEGEIAAGKQFLAEKTSKDGTPPPQFGVPLVQGLSEFYYVNARAKVGATVTLLTNEAERKEAYSKLGSWDPLRDELDVEEFIKMWRKKCPKPKVKNPKRPGRKICVVLLDQAHVICGIGNYLRADILYLAKIDPRKPANELTDAELKELHKWTIYVVKEAYKCGGTTFIDFSGPDGEPGKYKPVCYLKKKDKDGHEIIGCGDSFRGNYLLPNSSKNKKVDKSRTIYWCPDIQAEGNKDIESDDETS